MSFLSRIRGLGQSDGPADTVTAARQCAHPSLTGQWPEGADTKDDSQATEFVCDVCATHFTPTEASWARKRAESPLG